jgi:hypothetical protein
LRELNFSIKMCPSPAVIAVVKALLLATSCQFFLTDPVDRKYLTNEPAHPPRPYYLTPTILTRGDILGRPEQADLGPVEDLIDGSLEHVSK